MTARPGTEIVQVRAADSDEELETVYSLADQLFYDHDNDVKSTPLAFVIDPVTGMYGLEFTCTYYIFLVLCVIKAAFI